MRTGLGIALLLAGNLYNDVYLLLKFKISQMYYSTSNMYYPPMHVSGITYPIQFT